MTRRFGALGLVGILAMPFGALAVPLGAPHDGTYGDANCSDCHTMYVRTVNGNSDFSPGCVACHNSPATVANTSLGFPWVDADQATPGVGGNQHSWSGNAVNARLQTAYPGAYVIQNKLVDGKLQCATCHNLHDPSSANAPNSRHTSMKLGAARPPVGGTSTGTLTLVSAGTTTTSVRVLVVQAAANGTSGQFAISHDAQLASPTWRMFDGTSWVTLASTTASTGTPFTTGTTAAVDVALDDPAVKVRFGAGVKAGDYWDFYISYPYLRASNVADGFCQMCHGDRVMNHDQVGGRDPQSMPNGVRQFSHPVNVALNANGKGYDRTPATILDADGSTQAAGTEGRTSNDLVLSTDSGGTAANPVVRCTTCHAVHNADSNSLTDDVR